MALNKWEFFEDRSGEFRWRITAPNGLIVGTSHQAFHNMEGAIDDARLNGYTEEEL